MKNLIKKLLSPRARRRILDFLNHLWCGFCKLLPLRNRVLFYTIRANGRLLDNSRALYDALDCKKVVFARMLPHPERIKPLIYYYLLTSRVIVTDDYVRYMRAVKLRPQQMVPDAADLEAAARAINSAERPFIYFGGGVVADGAGDEVVELAKRISAPIGCSLMGVSGIPTRTPNFLGMQGMHGHFASTKALNASDCLIALGVRFNDRATGDRTKFGPSGKVVRIDIDSSELSKTLDDKVELLGDVEETLRALLPLIEPNTHEAWGRKVRELRAEEKGYDDYRDGMTPKNLMIAIDRIRPHESAVVTDVGQHQMWAAQYLTFVHPREFITSGGLGTMGFGFGAAIGAALGTGCRSVLITGDGSFAMDMAETITAADHDIPVTVVLLNNGTLGMVRQMQSLFRHQRYSETTLSHKGADFCAIARGMGAKATRTETLEDFSRAFEASFSEAGPVLIECPIGIDEFVTPVLQIGASMDELIVNMDDVKQRMGR